jgi:hypothetical protein
MLLGNRQASDERTSIRVWCRHPELAPVHRNEVRARHLLLTTSGPERRKKSKKPLKGVVCLLTTGGLLCGRTCQALFIVFPTSCAHSPCGRSDGSVSPSLCWWLHDPWSSLAPNDLLSVLTTLGQAPDPACALGACEAPGGQPLLIIGSRCEPVPRNELSTPAQNRSPSPRDLCARWDGLAGHLHLEHCSHWEFPHLQEAPQGDQ